MHEVLTFSYAQFLDQIGEMYFGVQIARPRNFMADMMGSFFGGGPPAQSTPKRAAVEPPKPQLPAVDLD